MTTTATTKTYIILSNLRANGIKYVAGDLLESDLELINYEQLVNSNIIKELPSQAKKTEIETKATTPTPAKKPTTTSASKQSSMETK